MGPNDMTEEEKLRARKSWDNSQTKVGYDQEMDALEKARDPGFIGSIVDWYKNGLRLLFASKPEEENYDIPDPRTKSINQGAQRYTGTSPDPIYNKNEKEYTLQSKGKGLNQRR